MDDGGHVGHGDLAGTSSVGGGCAESPVATDGDLACLVGHPSGQRVRARVSSLDKLHGKRPYLLTIDSVSSIGSLEGPDRLGDVICDSDDDVMMKSLDSDHHVVDQDPGILFVIFFQFLILIHVFNFRFLF